MVRRFQSTLPPKRGLSLVDNIITQTELYYKPAKRWKLAAQFRYNYRNDTNGGIQGFENMLRYRLGSREKSQGQTGEFRIPYHVSRPFFT